MAKQPSDLATEQLRGILSEIGGIDYEWLTEELRQIDYLENPHPSYKKEIEKTFSGTWDEFVFIWRSYHIYCIAKRLWRKFERIAKKYPNFDTYVQQIADENAKNDRS